MPLNTDTLSTIRNRIEGDINGGLPGADSRLRRSVLGVLSFVFASLSWAMFQFLAYVARQRLPDTADDDQLDRFGSLHGVIRAAPATASGTVTAAGAENSPIPAGTALQTAANVAYVTTADARIVGRTATLSVQASTPGSGGNQAVGTTLSFIAPVAGVNMATSVVAITGGLDREDDDSYRGRIIDHLRNPPQGGTLDDYVAWAQSVPGVTRAWSRTNYVGAGTVGVFFLFDNRDNIFPTADDLAGMQALLNGKAPSTDIVYAVAPIANPMNVTVKLNPSNAAIQAAVAAELADLIQREAAPGMPILLSHIEGAVDLGAGNGDWVVTMPGANFTNSPAQIATLGVITWAPWP